MNKIVCLKRMLIFTARRLYASATNMHSAVYAACGSVSVCLSVCPSIRSRRFTETAGWIELYFLHSLYPRFILELL